MKFWNEEISTRHNPTQTHEKGVNAVGKHAFQKYLYWQLKLFPYRIIYVVPNITAAHFLLFLYFFYS